MNNRAFSVRAHRDLNQRDDALTYEHVGIFGQNLTYQPISALAWLGICFLIEKNSQSSQEVREHSHKYLIHMYTGLISLYRFFHKGSADVISLGRRTKAHCRERIGRATTPHSKTYRNAVLSHFIHTTFSMPSTLTNFRSQLYNSPRHHTSVMNNSPPYAT